MEMSENISPLDNRYQGVVRPLARYFSEDAFIRYRIRVEQRYLQALLDELKIRADLGDFLGPVTAEDIATVKEIERSGWGEIPATHHDGKAIEYFLKTRLDPRLCEYVHFGLTTEDVSNIALAMMIRDGLEKELIPAIKTLLEDIRTMAMEYRRDAMVGRTHGQWASPTTFGKELLVFVRRLEGEVERLKTARLEAKLSGAVGSYSALKFAVAEIDWLAFSRKFIRSFDLTPALVTTQIVPPESYLRVFQSFQLINSILIDLCRDLWRYISDGWVVQKPVEGEIGSSVMPHKVNPIHFENAEGNLKIANAFFECFGRELPVSRLQRDLSDSTIKRNFGVALAHSYLAYHSCREGLTRIRPDRALMRKLLDDHPEVVTEGIQTELRKHLPEPYERLKELTRGKIITREDLHRFIDSLKVPEEVKEKFKNLTPSNYLGEIDRLF